MFRLSRTRVLGTEETRVGDRHRTPPCGWTGSNSLGTKARCDNRWRPGGPYACRVHNHFWKTGTRSRRSSWFQGQRRWWVSLVPESRYPPCPPTLGPRGQRNRTSVPEPRVHGRVTDTGPRLTTPVPRLCPSRALPLLTAGTLLVLPFSPLSQSRRGRCVISTGRVGFKVNPGLYSRPPLPIFLIRRGLL